jgi:hypothetical protein
MATRKVKSATKPATKRTKSKLTPANGEVAPENGASTAVPSPTDDQIRVRAYEIFLARGGVHGDDWNDWFLAQRELTK